MPCGLQQPEAGSGNGRLRRSNIELLRLACIFLIVLRHYSTQADWGGFSAAHWSWQVLFLQLITIGGAVANDVFLLVSGYFMIGKTVNWKRVSGLIAEMFFYSWATMGVVYGFGVVPFSKPGMLHALFPIWFGYNWYVCCYVVLCCFLPFLNPFLDGLDKRSYRNLLVVTLLIWSVAHTFRATTYMGTHYCLDRFVVMYAVGGYIRKHGIQPAGRTWRFHCFVLFAALGVSTAVLSCTGRALKADALVAHATYFSHAANIVEVAAAISLFQWVIQGKPFYSRGVNTLAKSVVGVFLIHFNPLVNRVIWDRVFPNADYLHSAFLPVHCLVKVVGVFAVCLAIDQLRLWTIGGAIDRCLDKHWPALAASFGRLRDRLARFVPFE